MSKLKIIDYMDAETQTNAAPTNVDPLPETFGRNLDTLEKARLWLTNPNNWHSSRLYILKWDGLLCTISREHGERLINEPWDDGLPWSVVYTQRTHRARAASSGSAELAKMPEEFSGGEND